MELVDVIGDRLVLRSLICLPIAAYLNLAISDTLYLLLDLGHLFRSELAQLLLSKQVC